jgi:cell division protein FtsW (lipid II flippase)
MWKTAIADWMEDHPNAVAICGSIALILSLVIAAGDAGTAAVSFVVIVLTFWLLYEIARWISILLLVAAAAVLGATLRLLLWTARTPARDSFFHATRFHATRRPAA